MDTLTLPAAQRAEGRLRIPGSKSISNRALLLAALAQGQTRLQGLLDCDDTRYMLNALKQLGVHWQQDGTQLIVEGCDGRFPETAAKLFLGNAGTAVRPLTAVLALMPGEYEIDGVARMRERPIGDLVNALRQLDCHITCLGEEGYPPLRLGGGAHNDATQIEVAGNVSSQFLSGLLMALPLLQRDITLCVTGGLISRPYVRMTCALMAQFGVQVQQGADDHFIIRGGQSYSAPGTLAVEADASSASYFLAAGAIAGRVRIEGVGEHSLQGDAAFAHSLAAMGAHIQWGPDWIEASRPNDGQLRAFDADFNLIPDAAMTLAVTALFADGPCRLRNIGSWRVKETDRIEAMTTELRKLGARVHSGPDWLQVDPCPRPRNGVAIDTYDDHRMAMCFSLVRLAGVEVIINDPGCVAKTVPDYFKLLEQIMPA